MDQLVVLQEIYDSFSKGWHGLKTIDPASIEGGSSEQVGRLLEGARAGRIDQEICSGLADRLDDVYEMKRLGDICRKAGLFVVAIKSYNRALSKSRDQNIRPVLLNNLGQVYVRQGNLERADIYYKKAMQCFESVSDSSSLAHVLGNLATACRRGKDWDKAIEHCYRSLKIFEGLGDELGVAQVTGSLGRIYAEMGERDLATRYFEKSLNDFQRLGDRRSEAWILDRLGQMNSDAHDWDAAIRCYNKSMAAFEELSQEQSVGMVLSNIGRMYLEKGEAGSAIDSLEKAMKLLHRDLQPSYQNTASCMAAAYCALAAGHMEEAESAISDRANKASQFYARASDRYLEIASTPGFDLPELKVSAGITRSLSYLVKIQAGPSEEEAVALAERAASALDSAVVNSDGIEKDNIESFQRVLTGMREALSSGLARGEPWRLTKSLASSIEHLLGGACVCRSDETGRYLCDALKSLGRAIEAERQRKDPGDELKASVAHLERAKRSLEETGTDPANDDALKIRKASKAIEGLIGQDASGSTGLSHDRLSDLLNYRAHREALLTIGWILVRDAVSRVNKTDRIYIWDDSLNPQEKKAENEPAAGEADIDQAVDPSLTLQDTLPGPIPEGMDDDLSMIEIIEPDISDDFISAEGWLVPVETGIARIPAQVILLPKEGAEDRDVGVRDQDAEKADPAGTGFTAKNTDVDGAKRRLAGIARLRNIFTQPSAILLVKAMLLIVVVLMAIDVILYLI